MSLKTNTQLRIADIAADVGGSVVGDPDALVSGLASLDRAGVGDLSFLSGAKYVRLLAESQAEAVLITPQLAKAEGRCANRIVVERPHDAMLFLLPKFYRLPERPFVGVHPSADVSPDAVIAPDATVEAFTVISAGAHISAGSWIGPHCLIGEGVKVGENVRIVSHVTIYPGSEIGDRTILHAGVRIGSDGFGFVFQNGVHQKIPHVGRCLIGRDVEIGANTTIDRGSIDDTVIGDGTKMDNLVHIAHNVRVGRLCLLAAGAMLSGSVRLEDGVTLGGQVGVSGHVTIGTRAVVAAQGGIISDVPPGETWGGYPARPHKQSMRGFAALSKLPEFMRRVEKHLRESGE